MASYYDYAGKALKPRFSTAAPNEIPSVAEVHSSVDGTGLQLEGYFATFDFDSDLEAFEPTAFNKAIGPALASGLPVLYNHNRGEPPIGVVTSLEVRPLGLWGKLVLPKPSGGKALEIFEAVRSKILDKISVGGFWLRRTVNGRVKLMCDRLVECSLTSTPTNQHARLSGLTALQGVKSVRGVWVPLAVAAEYKSIMDEASGLEWLAAGLQQKVDLEAVEVAVARANLGIRSR